jgi:hypothetical protein
MADTFVDDNGVSCFVDDNGVTCWVDDNGIELCCDGGITTVRTTQPRGKGRHHQIHFPGPWTLSR